MEGISSMEQDFPCFLFPLQPKMPSEMLLQRDREEEPMAGAAMRGITPLLINGKHLLGLTPYHISRDITLSSRKYFMNSLTSGIDLVYQPTQS